MSRRRPKASEASEAGGEASVCSAPGLRRPIAALVICFLLVGTVSRVAPLFDSEGRLLRQFPSEDAYLMLTIARNLALGRGMSIAEGTIPTNGTQPLATLLWAGVFRAVDGERKAGVAGVLGLELLIGAIGACLLFRLARASWPGPAGLETASLAAALWWASPLTVRHGMNGLETGLYAALVLAVVLVLLRERQGPALGHWALVGLLLGLAFLARNDAILLCAAVGGGHLAGALPSSRASLAGRALGLGVAGTVTLAVASPWLVYNLTRFGSVVPISGQSEGLGARFGENLDALPPPLAEYVTMLLPIPSWWESAPAVILGSVLLAAAALVLAGLRGWARPHTRPLVVVVGLFGLGLMTFYGLLFRAPYFMSRYLFPLSPFLALAWAGAFLALWDARGPRSGSWARPVAVAVAGGLAIGLNARLYYLGDEHEHFQVVEWVKKNVPDDTWVGAIQTGTLGFFHERTINLDGKVNPRALAARREEEIPQYVLDTGIQYLVDWVGIATWMKHPEIESNFVVVTRDPRRNLAVLKRVTPLEGSRGTPREASGRRSATWEGL